MRGWEETSVMEKQKQFMGHWSVFVNDSPVAVAAAAVVAWLSCSSVDLPNLFGEKCSKETGGSVDI